MEEDHFGLLGAPKPGTEFVNLTCVITSIV